MNAKISDFHTSTTKTFNLTITLDGNLPDIRKDVVTMWLKRSGSESDAVLTKNADVTTHGNVGTAIFTLSPTETAINAGTYHIKILWTRQNGDVHMLYDSPVLVTPG
jgi:hypothetical protein